jgi:hypothetical protein
MIHQSIHHDALQSPWNSAELVDRVPPKDRQTNWKDEWLAGTIPKTLVHFTPQGMGTAPTNSRVCTQLLETQYPQNDPPWTRHGYDTLHQSLWAFHNIIQFSCSQPTNQIAVFSRLNWFILWNARSECRSDTRPSPHCPGVTLDSPRDTGGALETPRSPPKG